MLDEMTNRYAEAQQRKIRTRSMILLSLILHLSLAIVYLFLPINAIENDQTDAFAIDLIDKMEPPRKRMSRPKPPLRKKMYDPSEELAREAQRKKIETAKNKQDEVVKLSERVLLHDVELNDAPLRDNLPLMTDARLRESPNSVLSKLYSQPGETAGKGLVTGRVRVRGDGMGKFRGESQDGGDNGLLGGGGKDGYKDRLGLIDFLNEFDGPQNVIYCLDVSASMQAAGLNKLELAIESIQNSILMLGSDDMFNIVVFSTRAKAMSNKMLASNPASITSALNYLENFTPESIQGNVGTNILAALETSLKLDSSVIVLVTDGLPTTVKGHTIETDTEKILNIVSEKNANAASIYVVALEIDLRLSPGAQLLVSLAEEHGGKLKVVDTEKLIELKK